ncbi:MAG TPA: outer membrane protein assembly factor BamA [Gammaproteobacteria bacterium]|jgi:outer membrane protein insertion porin family|nr:outer membrane protein assembly factor BamA [Gammaproteobacteria bacterium]MDB3908004.1 outer membrane protein assembly factor BamA [Gammaproteobacteria bacterium]HAS49329.1 outer membrane protein assembly factor BamA [Gammaproteobacteria bacterium]
MKKLLFCLLVAFGISKSLNAQEFVIADIIVDGYQRISPGIIYNLLPVGIGDTVGAGTSAQIIRELSESEYFDEIEVAREGNILVVTVLERPSVAEITIEGNSILETEAILENMATAEIAEGQIFTRPALEVIRQGIQDVYSSRGRYGAAVEIEVEELPRNRVAIKLNINEGEESRIRHINIVGNEAFSEEELLGLFELGTKPFYLLLSRKDRYSREQFSGDLERLESFYLDNGYVEFNIDSTPISITPDRKEVYITININEGDLFTINEVDLAGDLVDAEALLRAAVFVRPGQIYSQGLVTGTEEIMVQFLGNLGYAFAEATGVPEVNEEDETVDVTFFIEPGNRTYVNRINFAGNTSTADDVLRREMRQLESAPASSLQIEQSKIRLERLGYFETVEVDTVEVPGTEDQIDVNYDVLEQNFGAISFQVGTGGGGNFFISSSLQAQNFLGTGKTLAVGVNKSRFQTGLNFQYLDPYFTPDGVSRGFNLFAQKIDSPFNVSDFNTSSFGGSLSFSYPLSEIELLGFDFGYTHTELSAGIGSVQEIISSPTLFEDVDKYVITPANANAFDGPVTDAVLGDVSSLSPAQLRSNTDKGFVDKFGDTFDNFTISGNWFRNTLNRGQMATSGKLHSLSVEITLPGSDLQYGSINYNNQMYWPLDGQQTWVVGLRTNLGYGIGYGDTEELPFFNNYFAGGLNSQGVLRGFEENSLGPQSTPGARYLTEFGLTLARDENGEILRNEDGSAASFNRDVGYQTEPLFDANGQPVLDADGNQQVALAVQNFFLDEDFDSFGGNILATATLELLFPIPFVDDSNRVRSAFFIDAGNVFSSHCTERQTLLKNCTDFDLGEIRYSAGISVTYLSPFGPLSFYVAAPFGKEGDDTKSFDFTVGNGF